MEPELASTAIQRPATLASISLPPSLTNSALPESNARFSALLMLKVSHNICPPESSIISIGSTPTTRSTGGRRCGLRRESPTKTNNPAANTATRTRVDLLWRIFSHPLEIDEAFGDIDRD